MEEGRLRAVAAALPAALWHAAALLQGPRGACGARARFVCALTGRVQDATEAGCVELLGAVVAATDRSTGKSNSIEIRTPGRTYFMYCESDNVRQEWLAAFMGRASQVLRCASSSRRAGAVLTLRTASRGVATATPTSCCSPVRRLVRSRQRRRRPLGRRRRS